MSWQYAFKITVYRAIGVPRQETYKTNYWQLQIQSIMQYKRQSSNYVYMKGDTWRKGGNKGNLSTCILVFRISQQDSRGRQILQDC